MRNQFVRTLCELAEIDNEIILITADLGFGVLTDFGHSKLRPFLTKSFLIPTK